MFKIVASILVVFLFPFTKGIASHIVGGELEIVQTRGLIYQVILKMYVDEINAVDGLLAGETEAIVGIYEIGTNIEVSRLKLKRMQTTTINYGMDCSNSSTKIKTGLLVFYENINLEGFEHPAGYYMSWQRCCRNVIIENIVNPDAEGMAFYTEFPPVTVRNSSPSFPQIIGDYACLNKPFKMSFKGTDRNGDSLVYRRVVPKAGYANGSTVHYVSSGPYPSVNWKTGFDETNQIPGNPAYDIDLHTGEVNFTPTKEGLYVFSLTVDEYRNGVKIGTVQRDFQLLVVKCPENAPTSIDLKMKDGSYYSLTDTLEINIEQDTCISILLSDSSIIKFNESENLTITVKSDLPPGVLAISQNITLSPGGNDTLATNLCFDACNKIYLDKDTTFTIQIISKDHACPASSETSDTLTLKVLYKPQINAKPTIGAVPNIISYSSYVGQMIEFDIYGIDPDQRDVLTLNAAGEDFNLSEENMYFENVSGSDSVFSRFRWVPDCEDIKKGNFKINFYLDDNSCIKNNGDTLSINIFVEDKLTLLPSMSPTNLFTPNGDEQNDVFEIPNLPEGNCDYYFKNVSIFNRWGAKVYESTKPNFKWTGEKQPAGVYFYNIDINKKEIKGWIEMVK